MDNLIYLDNAATTRISPAVLEVMEPYMTDFYGNASTLYSLGRHSAAALDKARRDVASALNCDHREIYFTSGGSESDNWAIKSAAAAAAKQGKKHIISSEFEHHAVLHVLQTLEKNGAEVTYLPVYENGIVRVSDLEKAIRPDTGLVSVMYVNNEIGTIQPISDIGAVCKEFGKELGKERGIIFHTDAVQALGSVPIDLKTLNADFLTLSGHKIHAPKGVGILYANANAKKSKHRLSPLIEGGAQESGLRAGTENVAGIVGLAKAVTDAVNNTRAKNEKLRSFREQIYREVMKLEKVRLNGDYEQCVSCTLNFSFEGIEGESLLLMLDLAGICCSSGSACTSGSLDPSHVLLALGLPHEIAHGSLRISMSDYTTQEEINRFLEVLPDIVLKLRQMSPLWESIKKNEKQ